MQLNTLETKSMQLKFRVWNGEKYLPRDSFCLFPTDDGDFEARSLESYGVLGDIPNQKIEQWTGTKDKNNEEIYCGDIVKATSDEYSNENFIAHVIFDDGNYLTYINSNDVRGVWSGENIEIIGNINENSELIKN
jgi:uncharacterized phage protein (TIGR01671 family)